jgi:hypothetical protein
MTRNEAGTAGIRRTHVTSIGEQQIANEVLKLGTSIEWFELSTVMDRIENLLKPGRVPSDQWVRKWLGRCGLVEEAPKRTRPLKYRLSDAGKEEAQGLLSVAISSAAVPQSTAGEPEMAAGSTSFVDPGGRPVIDEIIIHELPGPSVLLALTPDQFDRLRPALALL